LQVRELNLLSEAQPYLEMGIPIHKVEYLPKAGTCFGQFTLMYDPGNSDLAHKFPKRHYKTYSWVGGDLTWLTISPHKSIIVIDKTTGLSSIHLFC